jgi:flagellar basal-body rod protein FlgB
VGEISDAALFEALRRQMTLAAARQVVSAGNLANVDTPGFKAREVDFSTTLDDTLGRGLATTDPRHLRGADTGGAASTRDVQGLPERRDGNTVQIDRELLEMTRASGEFQRAQTALAAKFRLVRYAISETR